MKVIRTFVAVLLTEDLRQKIAQVQGEAKKLAPDVKWVAPENLHVTLKFLGDVCESKIGDVCDAVGEAARAVPAFDLSVSGLGAFPSPARARVVWVGIDRGREELAGLAAGVNDRLAKLGFEREDRAFKSHITIGRVKTSRLLDELARGIGEIDASDMGSQRVASVAVMQSDLQREGPVYSVLKKLELA